jgi:monofunctional glycosyltransferase
MRLPLKKALPGLALAMLAGAAYLWWGLPPRAAVRALAHETPARTSLMHQREEEARAAGRTPSIVQQQTVPISRVSRHLIHAVVAAEDQKFFGHEGVDWEAITESMEVNTAGRRFARGGSTITQQLAKNLFFTTHKTLTRKLRELVVARWLEDELSKKRILELYLNLIEWGDGIYGCQAAALRYYGKPCSDLDATEAAGLAAMIPNPRRINPRVNPARHGRAQRRVLWLMAHAGYLGRGAGGFGSEPPPVDEVEEGVEEETEPARPTPEPVTSPSAAPSATASPSAPSSEPDLLHLAVLEDDREVGVGPPLLVLERDLLLRLAEDLDHLERRHARLDLLLRGGGHPGGGSGRACA